MKININEIKTIELKKSYIVKEIIYHPPHHYKLWLFGSVTINESWENVYTHDWHLTRENIIHDYINNNKYHDDTIVYNYDIINDVLPFKWSEDCNHVMAKDYILITLKGEREKQLKLCFESEKEATDMYNSIDEQYIRKNKFIQTDNI